MSCENPVYTRPPGGAASADASIVLAPSLMAYPPMMTRAAGLAVGTWQQLSAVSTAYHALSA